MRNTRICRATGTLADGRTANHDLVVSLNALRFDNADAERFRQGAELRVLQAYYVAHDQVPERIYWVRDDGRELIEPAPVEVEWLSNQADPVAIFPEGRLRDTRDRARQWSTEQIVTAALGDVDQRALLKPWDIDALIKELNRRTNSEAGR